MIDKNVENKFYELKNKEIIKILAIESSCDETSVAIVENGRKILSNIVSTQIPIHERFGGVVPEVASRNHITAISNVTRAALKESGLGFSDIDAIAVTYGAGLIGALLVGVNFAKSLAYALGLPLVAVSHIEGHIAANYISHKDLTPPFVCLMVSGGHTAILKIDDYVSHSLIGTTVDDAAGEAFDKVARVVGLGYPGGPKVDNLAKEGLPCIVFKQKDSLKNSKNFSFSGIKTAVINYVHNETQKGNQINAADLCASFEDYVANELSRKTIDACCENGQTKLVVAGGVSANSYLKKVLNEETAKNGIELFMPELSLCTDNAAMIASAAYFMAKKGLGLSDYSLTASSSVRL
ncbi:MAG: tRNA (adenosine(37)-N6)-threonylcarbamoyltransferase complex transferase subunit TsaD [Clostridia bacterium]